ncbi:hypothetical protein C1H46_009067 [Malus baccata]|uniref:Uncharacterized protein n=1 Tax=Malus baccata TaxID=106549 RepID=A0A540N2N2_MALBA|nr:hypothetical protein C1H46_009067 [Malus baccata]
MAVDFMGYRNTITSSSTKSFSAKLEENAVQEATSGLESVEKLIRLLSQAQQNRHQGKYPLTAIDMDCRAVADVAVSKFKKSIKVYHATPIQQISSTSHNHVIFAVAARSVLRSSAARTTVASRLASIPRIPCAFLLFSIPLGLHKHTLASVLVSCDFPFLFGVFQKGQVLLGKSAALPPVSLSELGYKNPFAQLRNPRKKKPTNIYITERSPEPKPRWNPKPEQIRILEAIFNFGVVNPPRDEIRKIRAQMQKQQQQ